MDIRIADNALRTVRNALKGFSADGCVVRGLGTLYAATGEKKLRDAFLERVGASGEGLFLALDRTGDARYREAVERRMLEIRTVIGRGGAFPERIEEAELLPFYAAYEQRFGGRKEIGEIVRIFTCLRARLFDEEKRLYADFSGTGFPAENGVRILCALIDSADSIDEQLYEHRRALIDLYREAAAGLLLRADESTGMLCRSLVRVSGNEPDPVSTLYLAYAVLRGVRLGALSAEKALPWGQGAFEAVMGHLKRGSDGLPEAAAGPFMMALGEYLLSGEEG